MHKYNVLLVGCTSKIARLFQQTYADQYTFYGTYAHAPNKLPQGFKELYQVDLKNPGSVQTFLNHVRDIPFKAVLFLASTYDVDRTAPEGFMQQMLSDQQVNVLSPAAIARSVTYADSGLGRAIFFGDSGLDTPKPRYLSYSLSKLMLEKLVKLLAVELAERAICLCFKLGPTYAPVNTSDPESYYSRNLVKVPDVPVGLIRYLNFIISEDNLNVTGAEIVYDGGTYLRRLATSAVSHFTSTASSDTH